MKRLGYLAVGCCGTKHMLTDPDRSPRIQLLEKCGSTSAKAQYQDRKDGTTILNGYIVSGEWFTIYEVHEWGKFV